jgi:hypothetical protein
VEAGLQPAATEDDPAPPELAEAGERPRILGQYMSMQNCEPSDQCSGESRLTCKVHRGPHQWTKDPYGSTSSPKA